MGDAEALGVAAEAAIEIAVGRRSCSARHLWPRHHRCDRRPSRAFEKACRERLYALQAEVADIADELRDQATSIDDNPAALHELQARREQLTSLRRKYGTDLAAVVEFGDTTSRCRLEQLKNHSERAERSHRSNQARSRPHEKARPPACSANAETGHGAQAGEEGPQAELRRLALPKAEFDDRGPTGFAGARRRLPAVSMNPGAPVLPMAKVASGGELSRIMLALAARCRRRHRDGGL